MAPTACRHPVSGLFHSPRGVLFTFPSRYWSTIGHQGVCRLGGWSPRLQAGLHVSRPTQGSPDTDAYGALTRCGRPFQIVRLHVGRPLARSAFARHYSRNLMLMSVPPGTEMFQFPGFASNAYEFGARYPKGVGCPIRTSTDQRLLAAPRGFAQRATSFIASWCQGIHRMPLARPTARPHRIGAGSTRAASGPCTGTIPRRNGSPLHTRIPEIRAAGAEARSDMTAKRPGTHQNLIYHAKELTRGPVDQWPVTRNLLIPDP